MCYGYDQISKINTSLQITNNNSRQSLRMKKNDSDQADLHYDVLTTLGLGPCRQGFRVGIHGWRKKCLYALILVLLFMVVTNLALTLWVLKVMDFSTDGMGPLEIVPGGLKLKGNAFVLENLIASQIRSRRGEAVVIESSRNITLKTRRENGYPGSWLHLGLDNFECLANHFYVLDDQGYPLFTADRNEVVVGADTLMVGGEGGSSFSGPVQTKLVRAESGHDLRIESPTRNLQIIAPKEMKLESRGGHISSLALSDVIFKSEVGSIYLQSSFIIVPQLPTAKMTAKPVSSRTVDVFQLCACESGKLFLASPHVICASENEDGFCR